jgi:biopolymer transport protein ExbB
MRRSTAVLTVLFLTLASNVALAQESAEGEGAAAEEEAAPKAKTEVPPASEADKAKAKAAAEAPQPTSLQDLLDMVQKGFTVERKENRDREAAFKQAKADQQRLLDQALAELAGAEAISQKLEKRYNENEPAIAEAETRLTQRLGELGELFGVVRQVSTDLSGQTWDSLTSSQLSGRKELLDRLGRSKELPTTEDLEALWFELNREIIEQGKVVRYQAEVLTLDGQKEQQEVVRAGPFAVISNGKYLLWESQDQILRELNRQPPTKYLDTVQGFEEATSGYVQLAVDPSRGSLLNALVDTPSRIERVKQGGAVGTVIIVLGILGGIIGVWRWIAISITSRNVRAQRKAKRANTGNPLGRILKIYEDNERADTETLELKLDEVVLRETSSLERFLWLVKTVSVVAPLLGLLGTVTGMIQTFQAITLFGAGDPKMMAGGISEALVTTMLGLTVAIPMVLLYETLANSTRRMTDILDEQSAGLIAQRAEDTHVGD